MTRTIKYKPEDNKFHKPAMSVMMALETAVLLLEQSGETEESIMKLVHMIHMGWIRNGSLAPEYLALCAEIQADNNAEAEANSRVQALKASVGLSNTTK